jgi:hypothetical protein
LQRGLPCTTGATPIVPSTKDEEAPLLVAREASPFWGTAYPEEEGESGLLASEAHPAHASEAIDRARGAR